MQRLGVHILLLALLLVSAVARGHDVPPSIVQLDIGGDTVDVELQLPVRDLALALPKSGDGGESRIDAYVLDHLRLTSASGKPFAIAVRSRALLRTDNPNWVSNEWWVIHLRAHPPDEASTETFSLDYDVIVNTVVTHKALVYVRHDIRNGLLGDLPQAIGLIAFQQTHLNVDGSAGSWWKGFAKLWRLGVTHIAEGTDHLMFLLVLLLPAPLVAYRRQWQSGRSIRDSVWMIAKTVSGFTVGHSITLALGSLGLVAIPGRPVEVLIAVSIIVSAIHAWRPLFAGREVYLAMGFGLIHGLAFASTLRDLNFDGATLITSLIGFNAGIECMQLAVVACVIPCLLLLSRTRVYRVFRLAGAGLGVIAAAAWMASPAVAGM